MSGCYICRGTYALACKVVFKVVPDDLQVKVYPNPASSVVAIAFTGYSPPDGSLGICNSAGLMGKEFALMGKALAKTICRIFQKTDAGCAPPDRQAGCIRHSSV